MGLPKYCTIKRVAQLTVALLSLEHCTIKPFRKHHHQVDRVGHHPRRPPAPCSSPFPEVDQALSSFLLPLGGRVRRALFRPELGAIEYEITGNRHCGNVGRQHRSNNVKYVVLLGTGVFFQVGLREDGPLFWVMLNTAIIIS